MKISFNLNSKTHLNGQLILRSAFSKTEKKTTSLIISHWTKDIQQGFKSIASSNLFTGERGEDFLFSHEDGSQIYILGMGEKKKLDFEGLRREFSKVFKSVSKKYENITIYLDDFILKSNPEKSIYTIIEAYELATYNFEVHKTKKTELKLKELVIQSSLPKSKEGKLKKSIETARHISSSINLLRDLTNEGPNILNSEVFAKRVMADAKQFKRVKAKVLGKAELKKEKMNLFLSVNAGSNYDPQLVHLTYTPSKVTSKTKHIALVGKGLTFDTGGYSLKPAASMVNMKFDMAGAATVYAAFRAACLLNSDCKISCFLGMTDNAVSSSATMPDSIVKARNGKTVEILNTDAEGRLVLADVLDYACDQKPDAIIDAATLTGAVLVALGHEICGLMSNNDKLSNELLKSSKNVDEYMWRLPIIPEFHEDMKSSIADLKNMGGSRNAGSAKAAAFLENFVKNDIPWAHLDIAGVADSQNYLPYCPNTGASGLIVRTLVDYINGGY